MSTAGARRVASTVFAAVALVLTSGGPALAAPPECTQPPSQTAVAEFPQRLDLFDYCSDPDPDDELTFDVSTAPVHGTAEISDGFLFYTSAEGYLGQDSVSFTATAGGESTVPPLTVLFTVVANQPPSCPAELEFEFEFDEPISFDPYFDCEDDGDIVDFPIVEPPDHGSLELYDYFEGFIYTPDAGFPGADSFTVIAEDHAGALSDPIRVTVRANRAPTCVVQRTVGVPFLGRVTVDPRTTCSDPDGDAISFAIVSAPVNGRLEPGAGTLDYVPNPGFSGFDRLLYRARDAADAPSNLAAIDFHVAPPLLPPAVPFDVTAPVLGVARAGAGKLAAVRRNGLKLRLSSNESGTAFVRVDVSRRTARSLGIDRKATGPVEVGRVTKTLVAGDNEVVVRLSTRARRRLARARRVTLNVLVIGRDASRNSAVKRLNVTLRR